MPAIIIIASAKPTAVPKPVTTDVIKLLLSCTLVSATPNTAQFVVISGR